MNLRCKRCEAPISKENINPHTGVATCDVCYAVFPAGPAADIKQNPTTNKTNPQPPIPIPIPDGWSIRKHNATLEMTYRWFKGYYVLFLLLAAVWIFFRWMDHTPSTHIGYTWMMVGMGTFFMYWILAGLLNTTTVQVGAGVLSINHSPVPWFGGCEISTSHIKQLYCKEQHYVRTYRNKNRPPTHVNRTRYSLHAVLKTGSEKVLIKNVEDALQVLFLEREIEDHLGIQDKPVVGEFKI